MAEHEHEHGHGHGEGGHGAHATPGGLNVTMITVVGITSVLLIVVAVYATQAWYYRFEQVYREQTVYQDVPAAVQRYRLHEERRLTELRYRDREQGLVATPIDQAMDVYLEAGLESGR